MAASIRTRAQLQAHAAEIATLLDEIDAPATARWGALAARLERLPHHAPWVTTVRRGDRLVAAALLTRRDLGIGHVIASMNEPHLPGCLPAVDAAAAAELAVAVKRDLATLRRAWRLDVHTLGGAQRVITPLAAQLDSCVVAVVAQSPRLVFEPGEALNTYLSRNTRSARAKARNRVTKAGLTLDLRWHREADDVERELADVVTVCRARDRQSGQHRQLDRPGPRAMYVDQIRAYAADGRARLLTLRIGGVLAAFAVCLQSEGMLYVHSNRAAPQLLDYSPGLMVNAEVVEHAHADPSLCGVDWGGSPQRFKMSGGAHLHDYVSLHAWSSPAAREASTFARSARVAAGSAAQTSKSLVTRLRHVE